MRASFVTTLDLSLAPRLREGLEGRGFSFSKVPYALFSAKGEGVSCTLYESGKLVIQGKGTEAFCHFYLEPEILGELRYTLEEAPVADEPDLDAHLGSDEAGKGDFFGPLVVACVYADQEGIKSLKAMGAADSKQLSDERSLTLAREIAARYTHHVLVLKPKTYNSLYERFGNLNSLLAWAHATALDEVVKKSGCRKALIDQFASPPVMARACASRHLQIELEQRVRAESDPVVAAASILARSGFLLGLKAVGESFQFPLPKGAAPQVIRAGREFLRRHGAEALGDVAKTHFKTYQQVLIG